MSAAAPGEATHEHRNESDAQVNIDSNVGNRSGNVTAATSELQRLVRAACAEVEASALGVDARSVDRVVDIICGTTSSSSSEGRRQFVVFGVGRERLVMHGFAMRLHHLGVGTSVACVNDIATPRVKRGDCVLVSAGPGYFATVDAIVRIAKRAGAQTVCFTAHENGRTPRACDVFVHVPAKTLEEEDEGEGEGEDDGIDGDGDGQEDQRIAGNDDCDDDDDDCDGERRQNVDENTFRSAAEHNERKNRGSCCLPMGSAYEGALFILFEVIVELCRRRVGVSHAEMASRHTNLE